MEFLKNKILKGSNYKHNLAILFIYVILGVLTALYMPGISGERSLSFIVTGGLLGLIVYLNRYFASKLRLTKGIAGSYLYLVIFYTIVSGLIILTTSGVSYSSISNTLALGLLLPVVLLILASPIFLLEKIVIFIKNKKYRKLLKNFDKIKEKSFKGNKLDKVDKKYKRKQKSKENQKYGKKRKK